MVTDTHTDRQAYSRVRMLGPFTFTFTLESEEFEKSEKVAAAAALPDL